MTAYMQISWTAANREEAKRIAKLLVEKHLVACAHIESEMESIFFWKGKVEEAQEVRVVFKTRAALFNLIQETIRSECSYNIPEILGSFVDIGNAEYLSWIDQTTSILPEM